MKNLKNMVSATSLMAVLVFGAVSANAQMLKSNRTRVTTEVQCTVKGDFLKGLGNFINGLTGITIFDITTPVCTEVNSNRARWS